MINQYKNTRSIRVKITFDENCSQEQKSICPRKNNLKESSRMQQGIISFYVLLIVVGLFVSSNLSTNAAPQQGYWSQFDEEDPEALMEIITRLGHTMIRNPELENNKRGLDLGLSRGFSGSQAAKHLMGLAAANYAGGPGRRRRSEQA
ncbi:Diuretic hormone class [Apis cerana cerana]|uniref:Diuretic hormone class n=2 Tax=Apis cerana TaxID=7461 RepID=A0A2A3E9R1_APICC|nr:Diuretic hormone class [Apis cerana cerana]